MGIKKRGRCLETEVCQSRRPNFMREDNDNHHNNNYDNDTSSLSIERCLGANVIIPGKDRFRVHIFGRRLLIPSMERHQSALLVRLRQDNQQNQVHMFNSKEWKRKMGVSRRSVQPAGKMPKMKYIIKTIENDPVLRQYKLTPRV